MNRRTSAFWILGCIATVALAGAGELAAVPTTTAVTAPNYTDSLWCKPSSDVSAQLLLASTKQIASDTSSYWAEVRDSLASMPLTPISGIALVTDETLCLRASRMLDSALFEVPQNSPVYMVRVGQRYGIVPTVVQLGDAGLIVYADTAFVILATATF